MYCNGNNYNPYYYNNVVPDSCCMRPSYNCGKNMYGNSPFQNIINLNGCLAPFMQQLKKDILFISAFAIFISSAALLLFVIHVIAYMFLRRKISN